MKLFNQIKSRFAIKPEHYEAFVQAGLVFGYLFLLFAYFKTYKINRFNKIIVRKVQKGGDSILKLVHGADKALEFVQVYFSDLLVAFLFFMVFYTILKRQNKFLRRVLTALFAAFSSYIIVAMVADSQVYKRFKVSLSSDLISFFFQFPGELLKSNSVNTEDPAKQWRAYRYYGSIVAMIVFLNYLIFQSGFTRRFIAWNRKLKNGFAFLVRVARQKYFDYESPASDQVGEHTPGRFAIWYLIVIFLVFLPFQFLAQPRKVDGLQTNFLVNLTVDILDSYRSQTTLDESFLAEYAPNSNTFTQSTKLPHLPIEKTNIFVLLLESTSDKYFSAKKFGPSVFPNLRKLRAQSGSIGVDRFYSPIPRSSKSRAMLFLGSYLKPDGYFGTSERYIRPTLLSLLKDKGFQSYYLHTCQLEFDHQIQYFSKLGFSEVLDGAWFAKQPGFDNKKKLGWGYDDKYLINTGFDHVLKKSRKAFGAAQDKPIFAVISFIGPHHPYITPKGFNPKFDFTPKRRRLQYLKSLAYQDALSKKFLDRLDQLGMRENSLIVVLGDHGESFGEHGFKIHNFSIYNEEIQVPFFMYHPAFAKSKVKALELGNHLDFLPTLIDIFGLKFDQRLNGFSLFNQTQTRRLYLQSWTKPINTGYIEGQSKFIYNSFEEVLRKYNVVQDPNELSPEILTGSGAEAIIRQIKKSRRVIKYLHNKNHKY